MNTNTIKAKQPKPRTKPNLNARKTEMKCAKIGCCVRGDYNKLTKACKPYIKLIVN